MPEQAYTPPETRYEVPIDELMKAIRGEPFAQGKGLWRMKREDINKELPNAFFYVVEDAQEYVLLAEAKLTGDDALILENEALTDYGVGLVLYKSIVPGIYLSNTKIAGLYFNNSQSGDIRIADNSQSGDIRIVDNSQSGYIHIDGKSQSGYIGIYRNSQSGDIRIEDNSQSGNIDIDRNSQSGDISIDDNSQSGNIGIDRNSQSGDIRIEDNSQSGGIRIEDNSQSGDISIDGKSQSGNIGIDGNSQSGDISIHRNSQSGDISIDGNSQSGDIGIYSNSQSGDIGIYSNSQSYNISIYNNTKAFDIRITGNSQTGNLYFSNALLAYVNIISNYCSVTLYNSQFLLFEIGESLVSVLDWRAGTKGELYISNSRVLHLLVANTTLLKDSVLSLSDTALRYGVLNEVLVQGSLLLRKLDPPGQPFEWRDIAAYVGDEPTGNWEKKRWSKKKKLLEGQEKKYNEKVAELEAQYCKDPLFRISHSSLGKTEITGSKLAGFCFQYYNSKLLDCFITGTELPKNNIDIYNPNPDKPLSKHEIYTQKTAVYNQFKKIYENQGDVVEASWYHSKAMENQQAILQLQYRQDATPRPQKWLGEKAFDLFGFWLNRVSNNHGESWRKALRFLLLLTFAVYCLYYLSIHWREPFGFGATGRFFGDYFSFLDITHRIDFHVPKERLGGFSKFLDYAGKISTGYGLYQFIAAFRRHGKKGG